MLRLWRLTGILRISVSVSDPAGTYRRDSTTEEGRQLQWWSALPPHHPADELINRNSVISNSWRILPTVALQTTPISSGVKRAFQLPCLHVPLWSLTHFPPLQQNLLSVSRAEMKFIFFGFRWPNPVAQGCEESICIFVWERFYNVFTRFMCVYPEHTQEMNLGDAEFTSRGYVLAMMPHWTPVFFHLLWLKQNSLTCVLFRTFIILTTAINKSVLTWDNKGN